MFLKIRSRNNREEIARQKRRDGRYRRALKATDQKPDEPNRDYYRPRRDHRNCDCIQKFLVVEPAVLLDYSSVEKWNDGETTSEDECAGFSEEQKNLPELVAVSGGNAVPKGRTQRHRQGNAGSASASQKGGWGFHQPSQQPRPQE